MKQPHLGVRRTYRPGRVNDGFLSLSPQLPPPSNFTEPFQEQWEVTARCRDETWSAMCCL